MLRLNILKFRIDKFMIMAESSQPKRQKMSAPEEALNESIKKAKPTQKPPKTEIISPEALNDAEWYIENGLRKVRPYYYTFQVYVKERWFGKQLVDIMASEFRTDLFYNHEKSIEAGRLTVNGSKVEPGRILKNGDVIHHRVHRHECPVLADPIDIIANTDDLVVINKPCSIPAHPCGRYHFNSLTFIMAKDYGMRNLRILYRLDRLTSGLMMFAKSHEKAEQMSSLMVERVLKKTYICRVAGRVDWKRAECHEPIEVYSRMHGIYQVSKESSAKPSSTLFECIHANEKSSVVKCYPQTGRTHQIRVHLQYLGHPILNDPIYHNFAWGERSGKNADYCGKSKEQILTDVGETFSMKKWVKDSHIEGSSNLATEAAASPYYEKDCGYCQYRFKDPNRNELSLFLHALKYEGPDFAYETPIPVWASEDYVPDEEEDITFRRESVVLSADS